MREFSSKPFLLKACILYQCPSMGSYFLFACHVFSFAYHGTYLACKLFFRALEFTLRTGDKMNLFRLVGYYIERKNPDRLLRPGPRLEAARWLAAAGQLHIEAKWGEVIKEDDGGAKKGEWQWQRWTMGVGDDETGTDGRSFYYRSTNSREMAGHWKEGNSSDEKVNEKCGTRLGALASDSYLSLWLLQMEIKWDKIGNDKARKEKGRSAAEFEGHVCILSALKSTPENDKKSKLIKGTHTRKKTSIKVQHDMT